MSLIVCRKCGKEVPVAAETCPHCGARDCRGLGGRKWLGAVFAGLSLCAIYAVIQIGQESKWEFKRELTVPNQQKFIGRLYVDNQGNHYAEGEITDSHTKNLSFMVREGDAAKLMRFRVGLKTKFVPFRRPAVGERVRIEYEESGGELLARRCEVIE
jgi:hypothetical protein